MNKMKKILSMLLCVSMALSNVQFTSAAETKSEEQYSIYPIVRDISYDGTEFTMNSKVNIVYENGIDSATKAYLEEVLDENGITFKTVSTAVKGESNIVLSLNNSVDEKLSRTATSSVTEVFTDVSAGEWYTENIQYVYDNGLMSGNGNLFSPTNNVTRAQVVATLYKLEGSPEVTDFKAVNELVDVEAGQWYTNAVCWAYNTGVTTGNQTTKMFNMSNPVTRQQLASFFYSYAELKELDTKTREDISEMVGADQVADYALETMKWAVGTGLITGSKTTVNGVEIVDLKPTGTATRAQVAAMIQRFCESNDL